MISKVGPDFSHKRANFSENPMLSLRRQLFIGEIDHRFEISKASSQALRPTAIQPTQFAVELTQRLAPLGLGFGRNEIGDCLGLGQIEFAVLKRTTREFA